MVVPRRPALDNELSVSLVLLNVDQIFECPLDLSCASFALFVNLHQEVRNLRELSFQQHLNGVLSGRSGIRGVAIPVCDIAGVGPRAMVHQCAVDGAKTCKGDGENAR